MIIRLLRHTREKFYLLLGICRVKTPSFLQMEMLECGAAALGIVLSHYRCYIPLEKLRIDCGVSRDGSNAANIVRAARQYGMEVKAYKMETEHLKAVTFPAILFWRFGHFLVLEGFGRGKAYLNDPASGRRTVSEQSFNEDFTGVVITLQPGPGFKEGGSKPRFLPLLAQWLEGQRKNILFLLLAGIGLVVPGILIPVLSEIFVDQVFLRGASSWFAILMAGMIFSAILRGLFTWIQQSSLVRLETALAIRFASRFLWRLLHLPVSFHVQRPPGDLATRLNGNQEVSMQLAGQVGETFISLFSILFFTAMMLFYSIPLTIIAVVLSTFNFLALRTISRKRVDINQQMLQENGKLFGLAATGIRMIESIKANASEQEFFSRMAGYQARLLNLQQRLVFLLQSMQAIPLFLGLLTSAIVLVLGSTFIMDGIMTVGMFVAFQSLLSSFSQPVENLVRLGGVMQEMEGNMRRIADVYKYPAGKEAEESESRPVKLAAKMEGYLTIRNLTFGYSPLKPPLITGFSLDLQPGRRIAIVGATGSGKSTVAALVAGLYPPWSGEILFDGKRPDEIPPLVFHQSVAMVDQNIFIFGGTIRDNITMYDPSVPEKQIHQAARDACLYDEIASRFGGFDGGVDEGGVNFSGGQRQRLEIARALANNPSLIILDEATSALDSETEFLIDRNLRRRGCSCLIIAHRLSTIRDCDEIIVLHRGAIAERGTHDTLIGLENGLYKKIIQE